MTTIAGSEKEGAGFNKSSRRVEGRAPHALVRRRPGTGRGSARVKGGSFREVLRRVSPWLDRAGRLSPLKLAVFIALLVPGVWIACALWFGLLGPKPVNAAIHETG